MSIYTLDLTVSQEGTVMKRVLKFEDLVELKSKITPNIHEMCRNQNVSGDVYVEALIELDGEYFDKDVGEYNLEKREYLGLSSGVYLL